MTREVVINVSFRGDSTWPKINAIGLGPLDYSKDEHSSYKVASCLNYRFSNPILMFGTHIGSNMGLMKETEIGLRCLTGKNTIIRMEMFDRGTEMGGTSGF